MKPGTATVHVIPLSATAEAGECYLTEAEQLRAASFRFPADARRWSASRNALRRILAAELGIPPAEVPLVLTEFGKPLLAEPFEHLSFSLSHCNDLAVIALCRDGPVGIDIEPIDRAPDLADCESTFCHPAEITTLPEESGNRCLRLLEIWTAKEALLKALGTGFSHPPEQVLIRSGNPVSTADSSLPGSGDLVIHRLHHPSLRDHSAALAAPASVRQIGITASTSPPGSVITTPLPE